MKNVIYLFVLFSYLLPYSSYAASLQHARKALNAGHYDEAYKEASSLQTFKGLLLATEVLNTKIMLGQSSNIKKDSKRAMALAVQVLAKQPSNAEAKMLYAFAYGFNARSASIIKAWRKKIPQKSLAAITAAREANLNDGRSDALMGGWHLSVVYKAGPIKAQLLYRANEDLVLVFFKQAIKASPKDIFITGNYIMMLTALGGQSNQAQAKSLMQNLGAMDTDNAIQQYMHSLLLDLKAKPGNPKAAKKLAKTFLEW